MDNKKAQTGGLITGLIFGVASLVIAVIIALVIVSTLTGAGLLEDGRTTGSGSNETAGTYGINSTGFTVVGFTDNYVSGTFVISLMRNITDNSTISSDNYTISSAGLVTNITTNNWAAVGVDYTYTIESDEEVTTNALSANFTEGIDEVSSKIPTVLLVAAIVLILGILAILVSVWQRMRMGGGTSL